jgi:hypothetical protein
MQRLMFRGLTADATVAFFNFTGKISRGDLWLMQFLRNTSLDLSSSPDGPHLKVEGNFTV